MPQNYKMVATKTCLYATQSLDMELDQLSLLIRFEHFFYHWGGGICRILKVRKVWMSAHHPMNNSIEECSHKFLCEVFHVVLHSVQFKRMAVDV
jgi:hypothetical protein